MARAWGPRYDWPKGLGVHVIQSHLELIIIFKKKQSKGNLIIKAYKCFSQTFVVNSYHGNIYSPVEFKHALFELKLQ